MSQTESQETRLAGALTVLLGQLEQQAGSALAAVAAGSGSGDGLATCARILTSLQGFIRGLSTDTAESPVRGSPLDSFAPHLYTGLFSMLENVCAADAALASSVYSASMMSASQQQQRHSAVTGLLGTLCSVTGRLLDVTHSEGAVLEALRRVRILLVKMSDVPRSQNDTGASVDSGLAGVRPTAPLAALAVVLVRQSSDYEFRLGEPAWDLAVAVLAGLQSFSCLRDSRASDGAGAGAGAQVMDDSEMCMAYAVECQTVVRQLCSTQPTLLGVERVYDSTGNLGGVAADSGGTLEVTATSLLRAHFSSLQWLLRSFLCGSLEFHAQWMRTTNSTLAALWGLPDEVQGCLIQALLQSNPVDLICVLLAGALLQVREARLVKHFSIFFETIVLIASKHDGALSALLAEACQRLGAAHANFSLDEAPSLNFLSALYQHLVQATLPGNKIRNNMTALRKWVQQNKRA